MTEQIEDIEVEIDLLGQVETPGDEISEQLAVRVADHPDRFADMVRGVDDAEQILTLGWLVMRVRQPLMSVLIENWFSGDDDLRGRAGRVLDAWAKGQKMHGKPRRDLYPFLDLVIASDVSTEQKVELLAHFVTMPQRLGPHTHCSWPFIDVMSAYPKEATELLFPMFLEQELVDGQLIEHGVIAALWKMPSHFCPRVLDYALVDSPVRARCVNGFGRASKNWDYERHAEVVSGLLNRLDEMWEAAGDDSERRPLLSFYMAIKTDACTERLRAFATQVGEGFRLRILCLLAGRGCEDVVAELIEYGRSSELNYRKSAVRALQAGGFREAKDLFRELIHDPDPDIQRVAIIGFGALADELDETILIDLIRSSDKKLAKVAARAFRSKPREKTELETSRLDRIRRGSAPDLQLDPIEAVQALPEVRPYPEEEITRIIAGVCADWASTRRYLVVGYGPDNVLMEREGGVYTMTELGESVWRVGRFLRDRGLQRTVVRRGRDIED